MKNYIAATKSTLVGLDTETPIQVSVNCQGLTTEQIEQLARNAITLLYNAKLRDCKDGKHGQDGRAFRETCMRDKTMAFDVASQLSGGKVPMSTDTLIALLASSGLDLEAIKAQLDAKLADQ
tara:strand:- start:472 stop:837 length:366 start_codon:yes stop_codon:yes gene_type:complete